MREQVICLLKDVLRVLRFLGNAHDNTSKRVIRVHVMPNSHYDYNEEDVYKFQSLTRRKMFEDTVSLLHCYSMKLYESRRRLRKIEAIEDDETSGTPA